MEPQIDSRPPLGAEPTTFPDARAAHRTAPARQRFMLVPEAFRLSRVRRRVRDYLTLYCRDRRTVDDMVLCVGEACANAIRHSGSGEEIEITLGFRSDDLEVLVKDKGRGFDTGAFDPEVLPDLLSDGGRGLFLMSRLSDAMELRCGFGLEVRLLKRAVLAASPPVDELDRAFAAALDGTITERRREAAERDELRAALSESDGRFCTLFEAMAEGVALHELVDHDGRAIDYRILEVNPSFERLTGLAADQSRGRLASELYGTDAPFLEHYAQVATSGEPHVFWAYFASTERHVRITAVSPCPGRFATIIEDATELRRAAEALKRTEEELKRTEEELKPTEEERRRLLEESQALTEKLRAQSAELEARTPPPAQGDEMPAQELAERVALAEALNAVNHLMSSTLDGEAIMQSTLDEGVRALAADAGAIELREEPDWVVRCQCGLTTADVGRRLSRNEAPNATRATSYRQPFATADMQAAATDVGLTSEHALRSVLAVPLLAHEAVTGCLLFYGKGVRVFSDAEIDFGRTLGAIVSLAVENARLREELRRTATAEAQ
jgi:anti-sigma regulatory factor (Ser/Thr protein kinase)